MTQIELETMLSVKNAAREYIKQTNNGDWEQRRYELIKDYSIGLLLAKWYEGDYDTAIARGIEFADKLINQLTNKQ